MAALVDKILQAYPFVQYRDDPDVVAFFNAYNRMAQEYLTAFNGLSLPFWPAPEISGYLLDWIAEGIYGERRPSLQIAQESSAVGAYNTTEYNTIQYAGMRSYTPGSAQYLPDEYFKRILTWNFYKGDGFQFSIPWLKRRIARFIHGIAGLDPYLQHTFDVSITSNAGVFDIGIPEYGGGAGEVLKVAIDQQLVKLPFIYTYNTTVNEK
ncbi:hypothetical protein [Citrobacter werkmanii]|uniref:hypothetical protein n=1 Tax=Citrobacter werkmanii TaxID=67827 RepID=UPI00300D36BF